MTLVGLSANGDTYFKPTIKINVSLGPITNLNISIRFTYIITTIHDLPVHNAIGTFHAKAIAI